MSSSSSRSRRSTRPALEVLDRDHDRLLYDGDSRRDPPIQALADGFTSYWMVLSWYQAASVRTLGHVESVLEPRHIMPESTLFDDLLRGETSTGPYLRQRLVESMDEACDIAFRQFRNRAKERLEDDDEGVTIDPENERNPLMRPAFERLDTGQSKALRELWTGFDSRREVTRWLRSVTAVTNGEKPQGAVDDLARSSPLMDALLDRESVGAALTRYRFAVGTLLPACNAAARTLRGSESANVESDWGDWKQG
jgi:hypothetical protein